MKEIVERLQENRNIERAKEILESNGYKITQKSKRLKESSLKKFKEPVDMDLWEDDADLFEDLLSQLGVTMSKCYFIQEEDDEWSDFEEVIEDSSQVKSVHSEAGTADLMETSSGEKFVLFTDSGYQMAFIPKLKRNR